MTCTAVHVRRGPTGYALEEIRCLSHDGPFHVGVASFGRYTWRPEDDPAERARRYLAGSQWFPGVNDSNAAEVLARNHGDAQPVRSASKPHVPIDCQGCGVEFKPRKHTSRYCSNACRWGWAA